MGGRSGVQVTKLVWSEHAGHEKMMRAQLRGMRQAGDTCLISCTRIPGTFSVPVLSFSNHEWGGWVWKGVGGSSALLYPCRGGPVLAAKLSLALREHKMTASTADLLTWGADLPCLACQACQPCQPCRPFQAFLPSHPVATLRFLLPEIHT